jgi:subtilisin family serine protease
MGEMMSKFTLSARPLAVALTLVLCASTSAGAAPVASSAQATAPGWSPRDTEGRERYIVILDAAPLASYDGSRAGLAAVPRRSSALSASRPDVKSAEAVAYVEHLRSVQQAFVGDVSARLDRKVSAVAQFQHAINAVALDLTPAEAAQLRKRPDVKQVNRERIRKLDTYNTPTLIGATQVWSGAATPANVATKGEGIVIGVIDTGINWASNSFKATGSDGYTHINPLGAGNYLGGCQAGKPDAGHCTDKLIGIYNTLDATASGQDLNGHGSHTASTSGGTAVNAAPFGGGSFNLSGIAPHANIIAYKACCSDTGLVGAVNQAVADGIVDVVNYSIGGTNPTPWDDSTDLAFLGAVNAGIFVAKSAGNDGPGPGMAAQSAAPWETVVAATTPARVPAYQFSLTAPLGGPDTVNLAAKPGATPAPTQGFTNLPLIESPNFADGSNDGCADYPANAFRRGQTAGGAQGIAVLHLDQNASNCGSGARRARAAAAGALAVIYVDPLFINLGASGASYSVLMAGWNAIKATPGIDVTANGNATASIGYPIADGARAADNIAGFSSRGPVPYAALKPDLSAPGVDILAAKAPTAAAGYDAANLAATAQIYALDSGTSMAAPHVAGAAALVRAINRSWSPLEVSSALMTTAVPVRDEDNATPSHPNTAGAGRIDLSKATKAGLVFDENYANFLAADPATGGKAETLNLASLYHHDCVNKCTFKRTVRSTGKSGTWTIAVSGLPAGSFTLDKTTFTLGATGTTTFTFTVDTQNLAQGAWQYGAMTLTSSNPDVPVARLPIAVRAATPKLRADATALQVSASTGATATRTVNVTNAGNAGLDWSVSTTRLAGTILERKPVNNGLFTYTVAAGDAITSNNANNAYPADFFDVYATGSRIRRLQTTGFTQSTSDLPVFATQIAWRVYADNAANLPDGIPGNNVAPVFLYNSAANAAGLSYKNDPRDGYEVALDVPTAGAPTPDLAAGRYWFSFAPTVPSTAQANNWLWFMSEIDGKAPSAQLVNPNSGTVANRDWRATTTQGPTYTGMAMKVDIDAACSAPWLRYDTTSGRLGLDGSAAVTVTFDTTGLAPGTYKAYVCLSGNGTSPATDLSEDTDSKLIPVTFTVTGGDEIFKNGFE